MDHTQTTFLGHALPMAIAFWIFCFYHSPDSKKARQMLKHLNRLLKKLYNFSIPQLGGRRNASSFSVRSRKN